MRRALLGALLPVIVFGGMVLLGGGRQVGEAKGGKGLTFSLTRSNSYNPVEQWTDWVLGTVSGFPEDESLWVNNPTTCSWHVDDSRVLTANGELAAGASGVADLCMISDQNPIYATHHGVVAWWSGTGGRFAATVGSPSNALIVTVCYQPQARCFPLTPVAVSGGYRYRGCILAVYDPGDPALVEIPSSNGGGREFGGYGVPTTVTVTITNPTAHTIRNLRSYVEVVNTGSASELLEAGDPPTCGAGAAEITWANYDYPFRWNLP